MVDNNWLQTDKKYVYRNPPQPQLLLRSHHKPPSTETEAEPKSREESENGNYDWCEPFMPQGFLQRIRLTAKRACCKVLFVMHVHLIVHRINFSYGKDFKVSNDLHLFQLSA